MTVHDKVIKIIAEQGLLDVGDVTSNTLHSTTLVLYTSSLLHGL
jgi:hypothetical protein